MGGDTSLSHTATLNMLNLLSVLLYLAFVLFTE